MNGLLSDDNLRVLVLVATMAAAWGDMRRQMIGIREEQKNRHDENTRRLAALEAKPTHGSSPVDPVYVRVVGEG